MMAQLRPDWKIGVSLWGQGDNEKLLWVKDHFKNVSKIKKHSDDNFYKNDSANLSEYYQPALSWTKKFRKGNLNEIIRCNELNFQHFSLEHGQPNIILVQATYPGVIIGNYLSEKYKIPYVVHVRLGGFMFEKLLSELGGMKTELLRCLNSAHRVVVTSDFQGKGLKRWIPESTALHNPIDITFFQPKEKVGDYIVSIGRLEQEKGFDLLIDAMKNLPDIKLKIGGSGSQERQLKQQVIDLELDHRVEFLGELDRLVVKEIISNSSFLVLPSKYETFGNVLLEAMACGKPVVATSCGGPEEIVSKNTGYLCECTADAISSSISNMMVGRASFSSVEIRKEVVARFSPSVWMDQLENILK